MDEGFNCLVGRIEVRMEECVNDLQVSKRVWIFSMVIAIAR